MIDESSTFGGFLTEIGEAKQSNANALEIPWKLTHMLLGDANGTDPVPEHDQTQLINRVHRAAINQLSVDPNNPAILIAEIVLPPNVGGWWIRELGLEDEDGDFVAVANCAPSYKPLLAQGSGRNQVVRMHLILSNTANVELKIDPSVVLATRKYVDTGDEAVADAAAQALQEHADSRSHPTGTTTEKGMLRLGTSQEIRDGNLSNVAAHPAGVRAAIDAGMAAQNLIKFDVAGVTNWTVPDALKSGRRKAYIKVTGAGGGGGNGGGGGGATGIGLVDLTGVESLSITVGGGGEGAPANNNIVGGVGGSSSFGAYITAEGGKAGNTTGGARTGPSSSTGGYINIQGNGGDAAVKTGNGGGSYYGPGGLGSPGGSDTGATVAIPGAGGGGKATNAGVDAGDGADGIVSVRY